MIEVELKAETSVAPETLASHAALMCYQSDVPEMGKKIDVKARLFDTGHHTTFQHSYFSFSIKGIAVGDTTFGLHLCSPFYNSDQRSGRYSKMFDHPDMDEIREYISALWPDLPSLVMDDIIAYVSKGAEIYQKNIAAATVKAREFLAKERPFASAKYLDATAPKIAQEQLRNFIPVIAPTALDFTVNLSALSALWLSAFTPAMRDVTDKMVAEVLKSHPELSFMFNSGNRRTTDWQIKGFEYTFIGRSPVAELGGVFGSEMAADISMSHPVDLLHFSPEMMGNRVRTVESYVEMSVATMGQDQRHRTLHRSEPYFTGGFYLPPVADAIGLESEAKLYMQQWSDFAAVLPSSLHMVLAPYGAMVAYRKQGDFAAIAHEMAKRGCFCAQSEIYEIARHLRAQLTRSCNGVAGLLPALQPPCYSTGKCGEGSRYCGRDLSLRKSEDPNAYFPERKV